MTDEKERAHNRVCRLAIERIGDILETELSKEFRGISTTGMVWLALKSVHIDCKEGLDKNIFEDEWMKHKYLDIIETFEGLVKIEEKAGASFSIIDINDIK